MFLKIKITYDKYKKPAEKPVEESTTVSFETGIEMKNPLGIFGQPLQNIA
ncbi:hypothetical protein [Methanosarcina sp. UBA5]|nr:hypothetical protein [Methanosarcina sp. UBA5]